MNLKLEQEYSKADLLKEIDVLKERIDAQRPLPVDVEGRVMQKLRLDWNYNSNAIEGNKLNYGETTALLMHGITAKGKPLKDHLDIQGHNDAIDFLLSVIKDGRPLTENDIRQLHEIILVQPYEVDAQTADGQPTKKRVEIGAYKTQPNHVQTATGETHYYATPEETPAKMQELMQWYAAASADKNINPIVVAALFHHKFVAIHPFDDGNGRVSRILMNLVLMKNGYPPAIIKNDNKQSYYALLSQADVGDNWPFIEYIAERVQSSLELYTKAINGGDIDEDEDIDKEIALLNMELKGGIMAKTRKSITSITEFTSNSILPLFSKVIEKLHPLGDSFFESKHYILFNYIEAGIIKSVTYVFNPKQNYSSPLSKELTSVKLLLDYLQYRDPYNDFSLELTIDIGFTEYFYGVVIGDELVSKKMYHENFSINDQSKIIKQSIEMFKKQLKERQSPK